MKIGASIGKASVSIKKKRINKKGVTIDLGLTRNDIKILIKQLRNLSIYGGHFHIDNFKNAAKEGVLINIIIYLKVASQERIKKSKITITKDLEKCLAALFLKDRK